MNDMILNYLSQMDDEQAEQILNSIDDEQIANIVEQLVERFVVPHLHDIRKRAQSEDRMEARRTYEQMDQDKQYQVFFETAAQVAAELQLVRYQPNSGLEDIKRRLRDPWTTEALLMFFYENDGHIDDEYCEEMKDFATRYLRFIGIHVTPELYERDEAVDLLGDVYDVPPGEAAGMLDQFQADHW